MARKRLTWNKSASPPPAMPVEEAGYEHPASQPDPGADDYKNGDTSSWAEDPHPGPYENSAPPAMPFEERFHPAQPAGKVASEEELERIAQDRAAKCITIAQALLGKTAAYNEVESQAYGFMHMPDTYIENTLTRLASLKNAEDEEETEDEGKQASAQITAGLDRRLRTIERGLIALTKKAGINAADWMDEEVLLDEMMAEETAGSYMDDDDPEAMLAAMMAEEGMGDEMGDDDMLAQMLAEEGMGTSHLATEEKKAEAMLREMLAAQKGAEEEEVEEEEVEEEDEGSDKEASLNVDLGVTQDVLGIELTAGSIDAPEITENDSVLASLFDDDLSKFAADDEEEEEGHDKEANLDDELMAALRPQTPKRASGATSVGNVRGSSRTAAHQKEAAELEGLWNAPPDVSEYFETGNY